MPSSRSTSQPNNTRPERQTISRCSPLRALLWQTSVRLWIWLRAAAARAYCWLKLWAAAGTSHNFRTNKASFFTLTAKGGFAIREQHALIILSSPWIRVGCRRQSEVKGGTPSGVGCCPQAAAVRLHNGTADRESHPAALGFGCKKSIEDMVRFIRRQSHTGVTDRDQQLTLVARSRSHDKLAACVPHRLDAIKHQVHEHLLQLHAVC